MNGSTGLLPGVKLVEVGGLAVLTMGKRGSRSQSQLLGSLTKKQKKHLRDFGEEHPFYDRCGGAQRDPRCRPPLPEGARVSRRWARARPGAVTGRPRRPGWASWRLPARDAFSRLPAFRWAGRFLPDPTHLKWGRVSGVGFCMVRDFSEVVFLCF